MTKLQYEIQVGRYSMADVFEFEQYFRIRVYKTTSLTDIFNVIVGEIVALFNYPP